VISGGSGISFSFRITAERVDRDARGAILLGVRRRGTMETVRNTSLAPAG
jgi:hypothetical protein